MAKRLIFIFTFFLVWVSSHGQDAGKSAKVMAKARLAWEQHDYARAKEIAFKVLKDDPYHLEANGLLADLYHESDSLHAEIRHLELLESGGRAGNLVHFRLGEALFRIGEYSKALTSLEKFQDSSGSGNLMAKVRQLRANCSFAISAMQEPVIFQPVNLGDSVNTPYDEYWPCMTVDGKTLVFTRLVPIPGSDRIFQEDFFETISDSDEWSQARPLLSLNTPDNEGAQTLSADGNLLFFTLCNHPGGFGSCDIWYSWKKDGAWGPPRNAGPAINTSGWEGQPSLSSFGDALWFSSARPVGKGNKDIWKAEIREWGADGRPIWGKLTNAGDSINTPGNEISPFIHPNGKDLWFASDTRTGFGGFDLFRARLKEEGGVSKVENAGYPLNSPGNEQGLVIERTGEKAFYASNRLLQGNMDIYSFDLDERLQPEPVTYLRATVLNKNTGQPVPASVSVSIPGDSPVRVVRADEKGIFTLTLPRADKVSVSVSQKGFLFYSEMFHLSGNSSMTDPYERTILLDPVGKGISVDLYNIFFETDAFEILPGSEPELQTLAGFLKQNPELLVEIQGHTDSTGSAAHNLELSGHRANSVVNYLTTRGIAPGRLSAKGYGADKPVATNETPEGRGRNRRTTIYIKGVPGEE